MKIPELIAILSRLPQDRSIAIWNYDLGCLDEPRIIPLVRPGYALLCLDSEDPILAERAMTTHPEYLKTEPAK